MAQEITPGAHLLDSREVEARFKELDSERRMLMEEVEAREAELEEMAADGHTEHADEDFDEAREALRLAQGALEQWEDGDYDEWFFLKELKEVADNHPEWRYGLTLIEDNYFVEYAQDFAEDIGAIEHEMNWPHSCIDWDKAANELKMDYSSVDADGYTYWVRD